MGTGMRSYAKSLRMGSIVTEEAERTSPIDGIGARLFLCQSVDPPFGKDKRPLHSLSRARKYSNGRFMLPAYPWDVRPDDHPLSVEEVCAALVHSEGNVKEAADRLKVGALILRKFIERSSRARAVIVEMAAQLADEAQTTLHAALRDSDSRRQDWAVRYILNSKNARRLGWGSTDAAEDASLHRGPLINLTLPLVQWEDGTRIGPREAAKAIVDLTPAAPASPSSSDDDG